jgi:hypothetical protein
MIPSVESTTRSNVELLFLGFLLETVDSQESVASTSNMQQMPAHKFGPDDMANLAWKLFEKCGLRLIECPLWGGFLEWVP